MKIIHKIDDFLFTIFPELRGGGNDLIISTLEKYYTYGPFKPFVTINENWITIEIDTQSIASQDAEYRKAVSLCEKGKYAEAKPILKKLIEKNPTNSEYYRIMGQILSDEGEQDEAINFLIDALRWDSKNGWALLMMGNIFAKFKNDIPTAMKYYDHAVINNPTDNIAVNNIGANLLQQGKLEEAKKYFWEANKINSEYPNTHFALGMIAHSEGDLHSAFYSATKAIRLSSKRDQLFQNAVSMLSDVAKAIILRGDAKIIVSEYLNKLEFKGDKLIEKIIDNEIPTIAKLEVAENYNREKHQIKYKPNTPAFEHLIMHELVHLDLIIQARKENINQLFISNQKYKQQFIIGLESSIKKLRKIGIPENKIENYCNDLFQGINSQIFNAPIDLFIEDYLYNEFAELRPYQFVSVYGMLKDGIKATTDKNIVELSPKDILSKSKIYNLVGAFHFKDLFGLDLIKDFNPSTFELKEAERMYKEFLEYKIDRKAGEEYELVQHWAEDLKLQNNFELVDEITFRKRTASVDDILKSIEEDPYDVNSNKAYKDRQMEKFQKSASEKGLNMAVVMYMVDALQYFENMPKDKIKKAAFEIASVGTQGIIPDKKGYKLSSVPGKDFTGYHLLAYYYVTWSLSIPEMVSQLQLPYDNEYKMAISMHKPK
jgi:tetratricopeptide (TPR) repeat protein